MIIILLLIPYTEIFSTLQFYVIKFSKLYFNKCRPRRGRLCCRRNVVHIIINNICTSSPARKFPFIIIRNTSLLTKCSLYNDHTAFENSSFVMVFNALVKTFWISKIVSNLNPFSCILRLGNKK